MPSVFSRGWERERETLHHLKEVYRTDRQQAGPGKEQAVGVGRAPGSLRFGLGANSLQRGS